MNVDHAESTDLTFETDDWEIEGYNYEAEFREAVETVRDDHDEEVLVEADSLYYLRVRWNDETDEVRFDVLAVSETFVVEEEVTVDA